MPVTADNGQQDLAPDVIERINWLTIAFGTLLMCFPCPRTCPSSSGGHRTEARRPVSIWSRIDVASSSRSQSASSVVKVPVFEVVATDSGQRGLASGQPYGHEVREQDAVEAIRLERPHIVIASWQVRAPMSKAGQGERGPLASLKTQPPFPHPAKGVTLVYPSHFSFIRHTPKRFLDLDVTRATRANARNRAGSQELARIPRSPFMGSVTIFAALLSCMLPIGFDVCKAP